MKLRRTHPAKYLLVLRLVAATPLIGIGAQHLSGSAPMAPLLEGAGFPAVAMLAILVPILEVLSGLGLVLGFYARVHAFISCGIMLGAIYTHIQHNWADEPSLILPVAVLVCGLQVLWGGAGAFSTDLAAEPK